jgi:molybdate transport system substrate-binding protein
MEVAGQFTRATGARVELVFGASGTIARQIQDGAPFEMFLAADEEFPNQLSAAGLTRDPGVVYAVGRLVIFAPRALRSSSTNDSRDWLDCSALTV